MASGKAIVAAFAVVVALAAGLFGAYKAFEAEQPPLGMTFERAAPPANATVHVLEFRPVHDAYFLEDHLDTAVLKGNSTETLRLRVLAMRDTLHALTGVAGPAWWVDWEGVTVRVALTS